MNTNTNTNTNTNIVHWLKGLMDCLPCTVVSECWTVDNMLTHYTGFLRGLDSSTDSKTRRREYAELILQILFSGGYDSESDESYSSWRQHRKACEKRVDEYVSRTC